MSVHHAYLCIQNRSWKETINTILLGYHYLSCFIGHFYFNLFHLFVGGSYISHQCFQLRGLHTDFQWHQHHCEYNTTVNTSCFWAHPGSHPTCCCCWCIEKQTPEVRFPFCKWHCKVFTYSLTAHSSGWLRTEIIWGRHIMWFAHREERLP